MSNIQTNVVKPDLSFKFNDDKYVILTENFEKDLEEKLKLIEDFMENNEGKGKSEEEKDELYKNAQNLWLEYAKVLKDTKYRFYLNRPQYKFLSNLISNKMEYDVNTLFFAIELTDMFQKMDKIKWDNDIELKFLDVNATEITYIYHLISKHKVKGLTKDSYLFSEVLIRIGDISKVFNYYDTSGKNLTTDIQNWVTAFEEGVTIEKPKKKVVKDQKES